MKTQTLLFLTFMTSLSLSHDANAISRRECANKAAEGELAALTKCAEQATESKSTEDQLAKEFANCQTRAINGGLKQLNSCLLAPNKDNNLDQDIKPKVIKCPQCAPLMRSQAPLKCEAKTGVVGYLDCVKTRLKKISDCLDQCIK